MWAPCFACDVNGIFASTRMISCLANAAVLVWVFGLRRRFRDDVVCHESLAMMLMTETAIRTPRT